MLRIHPVVCLSLLALGGCANELSVPEEPVYHPLPDEDVEAPAPSPRDERDDGQGGGADVALEEPAAEEKPAEEEPAPATPALACPGDDAFEPNDAQAEAGTIAPGALVGAVACAGDADWFRVEVAAGCAVSARIAFLHEQGDLDLALFSPEGTELASSAGVSDGEAVSFTATTGGLHAVRVQPYGDAENVFSLSVQVTCDVEPAADPCPDDADLDAPTDAAPIADFASGESCLGDSDWYGVEVQAGCTLRATLSFTHEDGDLDLVLEDAVGQRLDSSLGYDDVEEVEALFSSTGPARLGVKGYGAAQNAYALQLSVSCEAPLTCPADDQWEPNDTAATSLLIFDGEELPGIVCSGDDDVWALFVPESCLAVVELRLENAEGDLDLAFHAPSGARMESSATTSDVERTVEVANETGEHFIRVSGFLGAQNDYRLYAATLCREDLSCPADDPFEPNDAAAQAIRLDAHDKALGAVCGDEDWYQVDVAAGCTVSASLSFTHAEGDLDLAILDEAGQVVASSGGTSDLESAQATAQATGRRYVKVHGFSGAQSRYLLHTDVDCP